MFVETSEDDDEIAEKAKELTSINLPKNIRKAGVEFVEEQECM